MTSEKRGTQTQMSGESAERAGTPPPYSAPSAEQRDRLSPEQVALQLPFQLLQNRLQLQQLGFLGTFPRYPGLPRVDYRLYSPPHFKLSADSTTITSKAEYLSSSASTLALLIRKQALVPPKLQVRIRGTRGRRVDFDVKVNLTYLLVPEDELFRMDYFDTVGWAEVAYRGGVKPNNMPHVENEGLEGWCRLYVNDKSLVKSFMLRRVVANLDESWIEGQLRSLVASLNYRGAVDVTFPVTHNQVLIQNPDKFNPFITGVSTLISGKNKYEVVKAIWPFATHKSGEPGRKCIVQSEETWFREWRDPIRYAIAQKRQGWVTVEDKLEALMEGKGGPSESVDWGNEHGA